MWFRNIILYRYDEPFYENEVTLAQALMEKQSRPLSNLAMESWGWEPPLGDGGELVHVANGRIMVCAMKK
ncbi:recombination-associated protein RdgC, partial [Thiolapillus sp.]